MITEDQLERQCLGWFGEGDWKIVFGPDNPHNGAAPERSTYCEVILAGRLKRSLVRLGSSNA